MTRGNEDRPRYYRVKRARAFWEPGSFGAELDFSKTVPLGDDGPEAKKLAIDWNAKLDQARADKRLRDLLNDPETSPQRAAEARAEFDVKHGAGAADRALNGGVPPPYPKGSLGAFYEYFRKTEAWGQMALRTREDYTRTWRHIEKRFGHTLYTKITPDDSERFHVDLHPRHKANAERDPDGALKLPWNTAHRTLKTFRALLTALVDYRLIPAPAPIGRVTNPMPPGRSSTWQPEEVPVLIARATYFKLHGLALALQLIYDGMLSPVDGRLVKAGELLSGDEGGSLITRRKKTQKRVTVAMSEEAMTALEDYLAIMVGAGVEFEDDDLLILDDRLKTYDGDTGGRRFRRDFQRVREACFPGDKRQVLDLRRTGATEARVGGADERDIGKSMANNVDQDPKLASTYLVEPSRRVQDARKAGRKKLADRKPRGES